MSESLANGQWGRRGEEGARRKKDEGGGRIKRTSFQYKPKYLDVDI
jgi:hypothetical protein